ncbi:DNA-processing protein DprA [Salana multivorans]
MAERDRVEPGALIPTGTYVAFDLGDPVLVAAAWSRLAEPGDLAADAVVSALGARPALELVLSGAPVTEPRLAAAVRRWRTRMPGLDPAADVALLTSLGGVLLHRGDARWPESLLDLGNTQPHCLWVRGNPALLAAAADGGIAVVGARASTAYGEHVAADLVAALAAEGRVIVSGGAFGIDAVAHRVALASGGATVAVMAGGPDRFYPAAHHELLQRVAREGCVVAEVPPGCPPTRFRFLTRNRLIAALPTACVVVEAGWRSGTLSTANHATSLLRPVGAVPGAVTSAASAGCHRLIREGQAVCVCDAEQVRELLEPVEVERLAEPEPGRATGVPAGLPDREQRAWDALPVRGTGTLESVARAAGFTVTETRAALGRLVLQGHAAETAGRYRRTPRP